MRISLRPVLIGLILLVAVVGLVRVVPATNSQPNTSASLGVTNGQCTQAHEGVSLVVDFGADSGREPLVKCAANFNSAKSSVSNLLSGWQLFAATGVAVAGTTEYAVGFVCRIDGYPTVAEQPCTSTPTYAQGHWAYFYSQAGSSGAGSSGAGKAGRWQFSMTGAADHKPDCGSVEGWLFVRGNSAGATASKLQPSVSPKAFSCAP